MNDMLEHIDGVLPLRRYPEITNHGNHLYIFRLDPAITERVQKDDFVRRIQAEGIPVAPGYVPLNQNHAVIVETEKWLGERRMYRCPVAERAAQHEVLWLPQNVLLGDEEDMRDIYHAVKKVMDSF